MFLVTKEETSAEKRWAWGGWGGGEEAWLRSEQPEPTGESTEFGHFVTSTTSKVTEVKHELVEHDLRLLRREMDAANVPSWASVGIVTHKWLIEALGGHDAFNGVASAILGREVYVTRYVYADTVRVTDWDAARGMPRQMFYPTKEVVKLGHGGWRERDEGDDYVTGDSPVRRDVVVTLYDPISGGDATLEEKRKLAASELERIRALHALTEPLHRRSTFVPVRNRAVFHVGDVSIGEDERVVERVNGRPRNGALQANTGADTSTQMARVVLHSLGTMEAAAEACGVSRRTFGRWLGEGRKHREPDDGAQLAALTAAYEDACAVAA